MSPAVRLAPVEGNVNNWRWILRILTRFTKVVVLVAALSATMLGGWISSASASVANHNVKPTLNSQVATFTIPQSAKGTFIMNLWTLPAPSKEVGHTEGTSGTLVLKVPFTHTCKFQVDVRVIPAGMHTSVFYSGLIASVPCCFKGY